MSTLLDVEKLKYPIGKFKVPVDITSEDLNTWISVINEFPDQLKSEVENLFEEQLDWLYRPGGWSIRQVVHHCADSHINSQSRFKLALTEEQPIIKPYLEAQWALLSDVSSPIEWSLSLLDGLHKKWVYLLENMKPEEFQRTYFHPESKRFWKLDESTALYAWHCSHHLAHVKQALNYKNNF